MCQIQLQTESWKIHHSFTGDWLKTIPWRRTFDQKIPSYPRQWLIRAPAHGCLLQTQPKATTPPTTRRALPLWATQRIFMQQAKKVLTIKEKVTFMLCSHPTTSSNSQRYRLLTTWNTIQIPWYISWLGKLSPAIISWHTIPWLWKCGKLQLKKILGRGMAQGNNKTGQKRTNVMFVMTHAEIQQVLMSW